MKKNQFLTIVLLVIIVLAADIKLFAQGNSQNNSNGLWTSKPPDTVTTQRQVLIQNTLSVHGNTFVDSLNAQIIKVGNNSLWIGGVDQVSGSNNNICADNGPLFLQSITGSSYNTIMNFGNSGKVGIGTDNPLQKLHLHDDGAVTTALLVTNQNAVNGLAIGITGSGTAQFRMIDELPMEFFTNNTKRMVIIKDEGYVGIGNFTQTEVTATLDINGTTRIRNLPAGDAECLLVVADTNGNLKTRNMKDIEIALLKIENLENTIADLEQQIQYLTSQFAMLSKTDNE